MYGKFKFYFLELYENFFFEYFDLRLVESANEEPGHLKD